MNEIKMSYYNFYVNRDDKIIIYNTKTGKACEYKKDLIQGLKDGAGTNLCHEVVNSLLRHGFAVSVNTNEIEDVLSQQNEYQSNDELFLMILPTEYCNFRCIYCYENFSRPSMSLSTIDSIKHMVSKILPGHEKMTVAWFGGEPMLAMSIIENLSSYFLQICKTYKIPYYSMMTTNGSLLTAEKWKRLKKAHITRFQITIDGLANVHDKQRRGCNGLKTWDNIISNLIYFRDNIKTNAIDVAIRTNITKEIYEQRIEYIQFLKKTFAKDHRFHFFFHLAQDWGNIKDNEVKQAFCGTEEFYDMLALAASEGLQLKIHKFFLNPGMRICFAAKKHALVITADGVVRKCSEHLYEKENYLAPSGKEIQSIDALYSQNEYWNRRCTVIPEICYNCKKLPLCYGKVCPAYKGNVTDTCGYDLSDMDRLLSILL